MDGLSVLFWLLVLSPMLPFLALVGTGLTVLALHVIAALAFEHV